MSVLQTMPRYRLVLLAVFLISLAGSAASMLSQYAFGLNPCVMCIQQRVALMLVCLLSLLALALPARRLWGRSAAAVLLSLPAVFGLYIAAKQIHLQSLPLEQQASCGAPWTFRLRGAPLFDLYEPVIRGTGQCGVVERVFGVPLAWWSALFFSAVLLAVWGAWLRLRKAA